MEPVQNLAGGPTANTPTTEAAPPSSSAVDPIMPAAAASPVVAKKPVQVLTAVADAQAYLLRSKPAKYELKTIDGAEVALVVPPEGVRGEIAAATLQVTNRGHVINGNAKRRQAMAIVAMLHTVVVDASGTKQPGAQILSDAHVEVLLADKGVPSLISLYGPACDALLNATDKEAIEAAKNA